MRSLVLLALAACGSIPGGGGGIGGGSGGIGGGSANGGGAGNVGAELDRQALSGARLKVRYIKGDDGSRMFVGFRDTMRNEDCSFAPAADGRQRCMPLDGTTATILKGVFTDSNCMTRLATSTLSCTAKYAYELAAEQCPTSWTMHTVQDLNITSGSAFYETRNGSCFVSQVYSPNAVTRYYSVTGTVPASDFAAGTYEVEQ